MENSLAEASLKENQRAIERSRTKREGRAERQEARKNNSRFHGNLDGPRQGSGEVHSLKGSRPMSHEIQEKRLKGLQDTKTQTGRFMSLTTTTTSSPVTNFSNIKLPCYIESYRTAFEEFRSRWHKLRSVRERKSAFEARPRKPSYSREAHYSHQLQRMLILTKRDETNIQHSLLERIKSARKQSLTEWRSSFDRTPVGTSKAFLGLKRPNAARPTIMDATVEFEWRLINAIDMDAPLEPLSPVRLKAVVRLRDQTKQRKYVLRKAAMAARQDKRTSLSNVISSEECDESSQKEGYHCRILKSPSPPRLRSGRCYAEEHVQEETRTSKPSWISLATEISSTLTTASQIESRAVDDKPKEKMTRSGRGSINRGDISHRRATLCSPLSRTKIKDNKMKWAFLRPTNQEKLFKAAMEATEAEFRTKEACPIETKGRSTSAQSYSCGKYVAASHPVQNTQW